MIMDNLKRVPWIQLIWPVVLAVIFYAYTANVKATIHDELKGYVSRQEFNAWVEAHKEWHDAVLKRIEGNIADLKETSRQNNEILKTLLQQRPPPRTFGGQQP